MKSKCKSKLYVKKCHDWYGFWNSIFESEYGYSVNHDVVNYGASASNDNTYPDMTHLRDEIAMGLNIVEEVSNI